jgi:hypothetical protein
MSRSKLAVSLFILSEANFFLMLIIAYVYYHAIPVGGPTAANSLDPWRTGEFSLALFASSATMWMADRSLRASRRAGHLFWLFITIALGVIFLFGQGNEYARLISSGVTWSRNLFGTTFFTLTGFHNRAPPRGVRGRRHILAFRRCGMGRDLLDRLPVDILIAPWRGYSRPGTLIPRFRSDARCCSRAGPPRIVGTSHAAHGSDQAWP